MYDIKIRSIIPKILPNNGKVCWCGPLFEERDKSDSDSLTHSNKNMQEQNFRQERQRNLTTHTYMKRETQHVKEANEPSLRRDLSNESIYRFFLLFFKQ